MSKLIVAEFLTDLKAHRPCTEAYQWAQQFGSWEALWDNCERADWMLWIIGKTAKESDRKIIVKIACECARLALPYTKDARVLKCIEATEAWMRDEATVEQVREARSDAADARTKMRLDCAEIVRRNWPIAPRLR